MVVKVRRGNTVLRVEPETLDWYMNQGYSQVDEYGNIIKEAMPVTKEELQGAYLDSRDTINKLNAKIKELQAEIEELKKPKKTTKTTAKKK